MGVAPQDLMVSKVAVIPPKYRPVISGQNVDMIHDLNYLYHDLMEAKQNHHEASKEFGKSGEEYWTLFKAVQAVSGVDDPVNPKSVEQGVKGVLKTAIGVGTSPKTANFQRKIVGTAVDMVGRGVVTADPSLDMDTIGMPINMAWETFKPYIIRRLAQNGMPGPDAVKAVTDRSHEAKKALEDEMAARPVVYNRAPALHRYAYTGAWAKLVDDDAIHVPYATLKSLAMDFDGDQSNIHVPTTPEAVEDVKNKLLPSKNLFFTGDFETHYEPQQDYVAGLHLAGKMDTKQPVRTFITAEDAKTAYLKGEIGARTPIRIIKKS
jgi:DNA-directed RNA polymerase subunit beta'